MRSRNFAKSFTNEKIPVLDGLAVQLDKTFAYRCIGKNGNVNDAILEMSAQNPDVMLAHLASVEMIGCAMQLKRQHPDSKIIILAVSENSKERLESAMNTLLGTTAQMPPVVNISRNSPKEGGALSICDNCGASLTSPTSMSNLSARQKEVMTLLSEGFLYEEIARFLKISYATVHTHVRTIYRKLQVHSRAQAVAKVQQSHLVKNKDEIRHLVSTETNRLTKVKASALTQFS